MATHQELEALHQEIAEKQKQLAAMLTSDPQPVEDYAFVGPGDVPRKLSDLFGDKDDLVLIHNMGSRCPYCTL